MTAAVRTPAGEARVPLGPAAMLVAVTFLWATNVLIARELAATTTPLALSFLRWALAFVVLLPLGLGPLWRGRARLRADLPLLALLGLLSVGAFHTALYVAAHMSVATNLALINSTTPIVIALLSWPLLGRPIGRRTAAGIAVGLAGALVVVSKGDPRVLLELGVNPGDPIQLLGVTAWAAYSVLLQRRPTGMHWAAFQLAVTGLALPPLALGLAAEAWTVGSRLPLDAATWLRVGYVVLFPTVLATVLWNLAVPAVGASRAGLFNYLVPVFASALAFLFLGEALHPYHAAGLALILAGFLVMSRPRSARGNQ